MLLYFLKTEATRKDGVASGARVATGDCLTRDVNRAVVRKLVPWRMCVMSLRASASARPATADEGVTSVM